MDSSKKFILAIDQGTTGTKCAIFDHACNLISLEYARHRQIYPRPGWVEHDPLEIWDNVKHVIKAAVRKAKINPGQISALGVTNQRETVVVWDKRSLKPIHNAIVWQDVRTLARTTSLSNDEDATRLITSKTGLPVHTYFSASKIEWILDNVPRARRRIDELAFGNVDSWIICNLTRNASHRKARSHLTDYTNASRTLLMDIQKLEWSTELLNFFNIPETIMPEIRPSSDREVYGYTDPRLLGSRVPVCGDLGDQQASLFGQTCFETGEAKCTYGTGSFLLENVGAKFRPSKLGLISTVAFGLEKGKCNYAVEGPIAVTGGIITWLEENLRLISSTEEIEKVAKSVGRHGSAGVYFVPAFSGLFSPFWDVHARGAIFGLTHYTRKEHIVLAALESICFQTRAVVEAMRKETGLPLNELKVDGGVTKNNYLMQLQSNILGIPLVRASVTETTSVGAAFAAGLAIDFWSGKDELRAIAKKGRVIKPSWSASKRDRGYYGWITAVNRTKGWLTEVGGASHPSP
ncbi:MAG: glycerol kinase GlpK [Thaumarchaeota archaeon]|nr:glycerol kinase GlpK [Nitrososphaerota archaeon]